MTACVHPGCPGEYEPDGYCGQCGRRAPLLDVPSRPDDSRPQPGHSDRVRLGSGLVTLAPVARRDPAAAVLTDPRVPEHRRRCRTCGNPVGQSRGFRPARDHGFCTVDGTPFSFEPRLAKGDLVEGRYEILGCRAYGGLGWIYLARDGKLGDGSAERWVVLKGLIDVDDPAAVASAMNERRFLVEVDHPGIVKIYDFAQHPDPHTGTTVGYIVMEYLGGETLRDIYRDHYGPDGERAPLPLTTVLSYGAEILRALGHLHGKGLVFCDLKPDNVIHVDDQVKLIDLGAVLRIGEPGAAVYGTPGYQAPELERDDSPADPGVASDIYTVGRTLAVLSLNFQGFSTQYRHRLPDAPLLAAHESYRRLLERATHPDPSKRFDSAEEMREQLHLVLAEVAATTDGERRPVISTRFTPERRTFGTEAGAVTVDGDAGAPVDWSMVPQSLPAPLVDLADPAARFLAAVNATEPEELVEALLAAPVRSPEVALRLVDARVATSDHAGAAAELDQLSTVDWRTDWYRGVVAFAAGALDEARAAFEAVFAALPGELAPKLALAAVAERSGDDERARALYDRVWHTDITSVSAAFGLARALRRAGRKAEAIAALDGVPATSNQRMPALMAAIRTRLDAPTEADLGDAMKRLDGIEVDAGRHARLTVDVLDARLRWALAGRPDQERAARRAAERAYRELATFAGDRDLRSRLIDQANRTRPKTLL